MSEDEKRIHLLFVVPAAKERTWLRAINLVFWALEDEKTFEVMSADTFIHLYGEMSGEEMSDALRLKYVGMVNSGDISKREWKAFAPLRQRLYDYWAAQRKRGGGNNDATD